MASLCWTHVAAKKIVRSAGLHKHTMSSAGRIKFDHHIHKKKAIIIYSSFKGLWILHRSVVRTCFVYCVLTWWFGYGTADQYIPSCVRPLFLRQWLAVSEIHRLQDFWLRWRVVWYKIALKIEAAVIFETWVNIYQTTRYDVQDKHCDFSEIFFFVKSSRIHFSLSQNKVRNYKRSIFTPVPCIFIVYNSTNDCTILIFLYASTCFGVNTSSSGSHSCLAKITYIVDLDTMYC